MQVHIILVLLLSLTLQLVSGHFIKSISTLEDDGETTINPTGDDVPSTKLFGFLKNWISPSVLWNSLSFPVAPNGEEYSAILDLDPPEVNKIDISKYNLELKDGVVTGDLACQCGQPLGRIVGDDAKKAKINDIPWTAALVLKEGGPKQPFCGATLINDRYLLTAGHCIRSRKPEEIEVWLNDEEYLITSDTKSVVADVQEIIKHPKYKAYFNDIALIKLTKPVLLGIDEGEFYLVNPICLPVNNDQDYSNFTGTVAGWGRTSGGGKVSPALLKIDVPIMSNEVCRKETKYREAIKDNMLCAGRLEGGADACQGDSGGPLIISETYYNKVLNQNDTISYLVGIVSWGFGCAEPRSPGVYTRVSVYPEWILENTRDARWCSVPEKNQQ